MAVPGATSKLGRLGSICLLVFAMNVVLRIALAVIFPLYYEEAYLWEWSRFPSVGYLEHPPAVAWLTRATGSVFGGRSICGIRFGALLFGTGSLLLIYWLAIVLFDNRRLAAHALLIATGLPLLNAVGVLMLPETPTLFFHLLFLCMFASALRTSRSRYWYLAGLAAGAAMLSNLSFLLTIAVCLGYLIWPRKNRVWMKRHPPYVAVAISLGLCLPFIYWNATHDWATLRLNFWLRHCDTANLSIFGTLEYVQEQLVNTSVFLAIPLIGVLFVRTSRLPQAWRDSFQLLRAHALSVLGVFLIVGTLSQTHPDWTVLAYPSASIAMAALYTANPRNWLVRRANLLIGLSVVTLVLATCVALVALFPIVEGFQIARLVGSSSKYAAAAEERLRGWTHVHTALATRLPGEWTNPDTLVFTDGFRFGSMLSFHRGGRPVVNLAPFRHEHDKVGDGQLYYQSWERLRGTDGLFVSKDESPIRQPELFRKITELEPLEIKYGTSRTKRYRIYRVDGFQPDVCD